MKIKKRKWIEAFFFSNTVRRFGFLNDPAKTSRAGAWCPAEPLPHKVPLHRCSQLPPWKQTSSESPGRTHAFPRVPPRRDGKPLLGCQGAAVVPSSPQRCLPARDTAPWPHSPALRQLHVLPSAAIPGGPTASGTQLLPRGQPARAREGLKSNPAAGKLCELQEKLLASLQTQLLPRRYFTKNNHVSSSSKWDQPINS